MFCQKIPCLPKILYSWKEGNYWTVSTRLAINLILSSQKFVKATVKSGRTFVSRDIKDHQVHHWMGSYCGCWVNSRYYRRSSLGQGGLEIKCKVIETPQVTERYRALVEELCVEPKEEKTLGLFILVNESENMDT